MSEVFQIEVDVMQGRWDVWYIWCVFVFLASLEREEGTGMVK